MTKPYALSSHGSDPSGQSEGSGFINGWLENYGVPQLSNKERKSETSDFR
ncbi:MAG: hypothetical protein AAF580_05810 [Pseudomonadota bacterium]